MMNLETLKFRVWSNVAEMFLYSDNGIISHAKHECSDPAIHLYLFWEEILKDCPEEYDLNHIQMFTGRQDKNKKDIYEGDFLGDKKGANGYVQDAWTWAWGFKCLDQFRHFREMEGLDKVEIIGNKYESPILVKEFTQKTGIQI